MTRITYSKYGRVYIPINIPSLNNALMKPIQFKVDTGADTSTISRYALLSLDYDLTWINQNVTVYKDADKPTTATGSKVNAGYVRLPLINILGYEGKQWPFQIVLDENLDFRNLLGRDLLTGFNFSFNNDDDIFTIERAKVFKPRFPFLPNQEINDMVV